MQSKAGIGLLLLWTLLLATLGWVVQTRLQLSSDLRLFMPSAQTADQQLLLDEIGEGPASKLLLLAIAGDDPEVLAQSSRSLLAALTDDPTFSLIANGSDELASIPESMLAYRYLLSPTFDTLTLDSAYLHDELSQRLQDLSSPAASLLKPWLKRDPTLETIKLLERWRPASEPEQFFGVWMSADQKRALLIAQTAAAGFDPVGQTNAIERIEDLFDTLKKDNQKLQLIVSGPGAFAKLMQEKTAGEASLLGGLAMLGMLFIILLAYRSLWLLLLGMLPVVSAALAGLAAVTWFFGSIHGITLAFGFTLIGVAQDYPMHLFSHQHPGISPAANARSLWPTLATGVASTCIAYLAFLMSGVTGLAQLGCFSIVGLAVAGLSTRYVLPTLMTVGDNRLAESRWLLSLSGYFARIARPFVLLPVLLLILLLAALAFISPRQSLFENNLAALTPIPQQLLQRDAELRQQLATPDVRYLLVMADTDPDRLLARGETLMPALQTLVADKTIRSFELAARYLPSPATQIRRQQALPDNENLQRILDEAVRELPFRTGIFSDFTADVATARVLEPLRQKDLQATTLGLRLSGLLLQKQNRHIALISLIGVKNPQALEAFAAKHGSELRLLDIKTATEQLVMEYRQRIIWSLGYAGLLLAIVVAVKMRSLRRTLKVLLPMLLTSLLVPALLAISGISLNLFHLIALVLAAGLGLDYALFFEHADTDPAAQNRTLHALLVCAGSTLMVFLMLATSSIPVLQALGITVALGVVSNFILAALFSRANSRNVRAA